MKAVGLFLYCNMKLLEIIVCTTILLSIHSVSWSQDRATVERIKKDKQKEKAYAEQAINDLKNGILLVRLDYRTREINYYRKYENFKAADKVLKKQKDLNSYIISAFESDFKFCPVYFFEMEDSHKLLDGGLDSVIFYDHNGEPDSTIRPRTEHFFIAEFGQVEQDTAYYSDELSPDMSRETPKTKVYYGGSKMERSALLIRNSSFEQLRDPFPYKAKYTYSAKKSYRYLKSVRLLNSALSDYCCPELEQTPPEKSAP